MPDLLDSLKPFAGEAPFFYPDQEGQGRAVTAALPDAPAHRRHARHFCADYSHVPNAAKALDRLPEPGESIHVLMSGTFNAADFIPAILRLAAPATIARLDVATLSLNDGATALFADLLDRRQVASMTLICALFYIKAHAEIYAALQQALATRGQRCAAVRNHAKVILADLTDGRAIVIESSANLRATRYLEIATVTHDAGLLAFHRGWITAFLDGARR